MLNAQTTLLKVLDSLKKQDYPLSEIIIVDNHSSDESVTIAKRFREKNTHMHVRIIEREKTYSVGSSYNLGINLAKSPLIILMHSDSVLPSKQEIRRLVRPFFHDDAVVATYSIIEHPREVWLTYNFWQKCQFVNAMEKPIAGMFGKFDCYKKEVFLHIGGFDVKNFISGIGADDANLHLRFQKIGKVTPTQARVVHLHYLGSDYSLKNWIQYRKLMARTYGRLLRTNLFDLKERAAIFSVKPLVVTSLLLSIVSPFFIVFTIAFAFLYMKGMYLEKTTREDSRILLLPVLSIFLIYYETFWMLEAFLFVKKNA